MNAVLEAIWHGMLAATWIQQTATVLGLLGVWLATRQSLWNFPIGLVQVTMIGYVFYNHQLYADTFLQAVFFIALIYGWWSWTRPGDKRDHLPVTRLTHAQLLGLVALGLGITVVWGELLSRIGDPMPWRDAFVATFGIMSQWLEARKKIEAWAGWVVVNSTGIVIYAALGLYWFVVLYSLYWVLSFVGWRAWHSSRRSEALA